VVSGQWREEACSLEDSKNQLPTRYSLNPQSM